MNVWDLKENGLIATNIVYNLKNMDLINQTFRIDEEIGVGYSGELDYSSQEMKRIFRVNLDLGEMDDMNSCSSCDDYYFLQAPMVKWVGDNAGTFFNSYPDLGSDKMSGSPTIANRGECLANLVNNTKAYKINCFSRWNDDMDINKFKLNQAEFKYKLGVGSMWRVDYSANIQLSRQYDLAIIPLTLDEPFATDYGLVGPTFCGFISTKNLLQGGGTIPPQIIPAPMTGEFFGYSRSLYDNPTCKIASTQKKGFVMGTGDNANKKYYPTSSTIYDYSPFCYIGSDNPSLEFDGDNSKFAFKGLHMAVRSGNGVFPEWQEGIAPQPNTDPTNLVISINDKTANFCYLSGDAGSVGEITSFQNITTLQADSRYSLAQAGIAIEKIGYFDTAGNARTNFSLIPETYEGTLFHKLGFELEQLMPFFGKAQNEFNRSNYNKFLGLTGNNLLDKQNNMVLPLTTNSYISAAINPGVVVNITDNPMENLGVIIPTETAITNGESDELIATNLPKKLDFPYLVVYSNLVENNKYFGGKTGFSKLPAMAYVPRSFTTGDYFFGTATTWTYTADKDYVVSNIHTDIRLPDGTPAPLAENSSIIYKITKPKIMPSLIVPGNIKENENTEKVINDYMENNNSTDNKADNVMNNNLVN